MPRCMRRRYDAMPREMVSRSIAAVSFGNGWCAIRAQGVQDLRAAVSMGGVELEANGGAYQQHGIVRSRMHRPSQPARTRSR